MRRGLVFLFGSGWWVLWHGMLWIWLIPIVWCAWWFATVFVPGKGPQGGEAIFAFLLMAFGALTIVTAINAILLGAAVAGPWWLRYLALPIAAPVAALTIGAVVAATLDWAMSGTPAGVALAAIAGSLVILLFALNLFAIHSFRARR
jgi:hypothetical protein